MSRAEAGPRHWPALNSYLLFVWHFYQTHTGRVHHGEDRRRAEQCRHHHHHVRHRPALAAVCRQCVFTHYLHTAASAGRWRRGNIILRAHFPARRCYYLSNNSAGLGNVECHPHAFAPSLPHCLSHGSGMSAGASWTVQIEIFV